MNLTQIIETSKETPIPTEAEILDHLEINEVESAEKSISTPTIIGDKVYFITYVPEAGNSGSTDCQYRMNSLNLSYIVNLKDASPVLTEATLDGEEHTKRFTPLKTMGMSMEPSVIRQGNKEVVCLGGVNCLDDYEEIKAKRIYWYKDMNWD
jgi:hypothetical protein